MVRMRTLRAVFLAPAILVGTLSFLPTLAACGSSGAPAEGTVVNPELPATVISSRGVRVSSLRPPSPVTLRGETVLVYELVVAAGTTTGVSVDVVDVRIDSSAAPLLKQLSGADLAAAMNIRGTGFRFLKPAPQTLSPGESAIIYLYHSFKKGTTLPQRLNHGVLVKHADGKTELIPINVPVLTVPPVVLGAPLKGRNWVALHGLSNASQHRRAIPAFESLYLPERYAIDFFQTDAEGSLAKAPKTSDSDYLSYGAEVLAVAEGTVSNVFDGAFDNAIASPVDPTTVAPESVGGNYVVLSLDIGAYVYYSHLKAGSLKVKRGQRVARGEVIALVGNTGDSTAPHLHLHVADREDPLHSEGVPFAFDRYTFLGTPDVTSVATEARVQWPAAQTTTVTSALPSENDGIGF